MIDPIAYESQRTLVVELRAADLCPCPADLNRDGILSPVFDFLAFQTAYSTGDPIADLQADGRVNLFDYLRFQTLIEDCDDARAPCLNALASDPPRALTIIEGVGSGRWLMLGTPEKAVYQAIVHPTAHDHARNQHVNGWTRIRAHPAAQVREIGAVAK